MIIDFHSQRFLPPATLADHARRRVHLALGHRSESIQRVVICFGGTSDRRGDNDMYCLMQVHLSDALVATVVHIGPDIRDVIDRTTDRVGRVVVALLARADHNSRSISISANASPRRERAARPPARNACAPDRACPGAATRAQSTVARPGRIVEESLLDGH